MQAPKAGLHLAAEGVRLETLGDLALLVPDALALGENVRRIGEPLDGPADYFFRVAKTVDGSGVDPIDAFVERGADRGDGLVDVLRSPGERPSRVAWFSFAIVGELPIITEQRGA